MDQNDKTTGVPWLSSYLLCGANLLMLLVTMVAFAWDFGLTPVDLTFLGEWIPKAFLTIYWATIILIMLWFYRITLYLKDVSYTEFENGPLMAAFGFIIPIMSLWKPYQSLLEIYKASRNPDDWKDTKQATIVGWWWAMWLIANFASILIRFSNFDAETAPSETQVYLLEGMRVVMAAKSILLLVIIRQIMRWLKAPAKISAIEQVF